MLLSIFEKNITHRKVAVYTKQLSLHGISIAILILGNLIYQLK